MNLFNANYFNPVLAALPAQASGIMTHDEVDRLERESDWQYKIPDGTIVVTPGHEAEIYLDNSCVLSLDETLRLSLHHSHRPEKYFIPRSTGIELNLGGASAWNRFQVDSGEDYVDMIRLAVSINGQEGNAISFCVNRSLSVTARRNLLDLKKLLDDPHSSWAQIMSVARQCPGRGLPDLSEQDREALGAYLREARQSYWRDFRKEIKVREIRVGGKMYAASWEDFNPSAWAGHRLSNLLGFSVSQRTIDHHLSRGWWDSMIASTREAAIAFQEWHRNYSDIVFTMATSMAGKV